MRVFSRAALLLAAVLTAIVLAGFAALGCFAWADEDAQASAAQNAVDDAHSSLSAAESRMAALSSDYDTLKQEIDKLQTQIDDMAAEVLEAQKAVVEGRAAVGKLAVYEYRTGGSARSLVELVLGAGDFSELLRNKSYLSSIMTYQADEVAAQQERSKRFQDISDSLNFQKDEQEKKLAELEAKKAEAQKVVADASSRLQNAESDQASRLAELQRKAEEMAAAGAVTDPVEVEDANTVDRPSVVPPSTPVEPDPDPVVPDTGGGSGGDSGGGSGGGSSESPGESTAGWSTGVASAYGGSTDPYTPSPGITATGAVCDDWSMGVAVPMAWPNYWQYYGRTVEISYAGQTVFATINDCGGMDGGRRSLDLQPGVWKAFGYSSCLDWGLRTVSYRIL